MTFQLQFFETLVNKRFPKHDRPFLLFTVKKRVSLALGESSKDTSKQKWTKESALGNPLESINEKTLAKRRESVHEHSAEQKRDELYPTFFSCLKSPMFFFMSFWAIVIQLQLLFVLGIMNPWLTWLADGDLDDGRLIYD